MRSYNYSLFIHYSRRNSIFYSLFARNENLRKMQSSVMLNPNIQWTSNCFKLDCSNFELFQTQVRLPKPNLEPFQTPPKSPNIKPVQPEMVEPRSKSGKTKLRTLPNPGSSTKIELWTHLNSPKIPNFELMNWVWVRPKTTTRTRPYCYQLILQCL